LKPSGSSGCGKAGALCAQKTDQTVGIPRDIRNEIVKIKTSSLLLLGFAVVLAGCAAFVARGLLAPHAAERPAAAAQAKASEAQVPPVWAAAAAKLVEPGEFLSGTAIKWVEMKADEAPASAISAKRPGDRTAAALLMGATVRRPVPPGGPTTHRDCWHQSSSE